MNSPGETNDVNDSEAASRYVCAVLHDRGYRAVFAGGCVRDLLLGREPSDYDVATEARPDEVIEVFDRTVPVGIQFGVVLVITKWGPVEVATFRRDGSYSDGRHPDKVTFASLDEDAARRDFTINGMYLDPETDEIIDLVQGQEDLDAGIIRAIGEPQRRFEEDALRMLRAIRFAARFRFAIDLATMDSIRLLAEGIKQTSAERICAELDKMLTDGNSKHAIELLDESGLLTHVLPEIVAMKGVEQPPEWHPEGDVYVHTLLLMENLDKLEERTESLAWGALLHDVGKPVTQTFEDRIRFSLHDKRGAEIARNICKRLRMPRERSARIEWLVRQHMRPAITPDMRETKRKRFVREEGFDELLQLCELDALASHGDAGFVQWLREYKESIPPEKLRPQPLIRGADLIELGHEPGPQFREILSTIEDEQLEGRIETKEAALALVRDRWPT